MSHHNVLLALASQFHRNLDHSPRRVIVAPFDLRLPEQGQDAEGSCSAVQPDIMVVSDAHKLSESGLHRSYGLVRAIISDSFSAHLTR
jgi:hypothetical protein